MSAACAEAPRHKALLQSGLGLRQGLGHYHALACGQPVGLDHGRRPVQVKIGESLVVARESSGSAGRHARRLHHLFGKGLGAFEQGAVGPRTEHRETPLAQLVGQPRHQRGLRPHHREVEILALDEGHQRSHILGVYGIHLRVGGDACVARGDRQPAYAADSSRGYAQVRVPALLHRQPERQAGQKSR